MIVEIYGTLLGIKERCISMEHGSLNKIGNIIYFSHGGGPLPILGDPSHEKMIAFMKQLPQKLKQPDTVIDKCPLGGSNSNDNR